MSRQQQRRVQKLTQEEIKSLKYESMLKGIKGTMATFTTVMREEFGYGDVRIKRIDNAVKAKLGMEVDDNERDKV